MKRQIPAYHKRVTLHAEVTQWHRAYHKVTIKISSTDDRGLSEGSLTTEIEVPWRIGEMASVSDALAHAFARMMSQSFGQKIANAADRDASGGGEA